MNKYGSMSKYIVSCLFMMMLLGTSSIAFADCTKDGKSYPVGTKIGGFVCTDKGKWQKK